MEFPSCMCCAPGAEGARRLFTSARCLRCPFIVCKKLAGNDQLEVYLCNEMLN